MKRLMTLAIATMMTLSLSACGGTDEPTSQAPSGAPASSTASAASEAPPSESTAAPAKDYPYTLQVQIKSPTTADIVLGGVTVKNDIKNTRWGVTFDDKYAVSLNVYEAGKYQCSTTKIVVDGKYTNYDLINPQIPYTIGDGTLTIQADFTGVEGVDFNQFTTYTAEISEDGDGWRPTDFAAADVAVKSDTPAPEVTPAESKPTAESQPAESAATTSKYAGTYGVGKDGESIVITQSGDTLVVEMTVDNIGDNQTVKSGTYTTKPFAVSDIKDIGNNVSSVKTTTTDGLSCELYFNNAEGPTAGVEILLEGVYSLARSRG